MQVAHHDFNSIMSHYIFYTASHCIVARLIHYALCVMSVIATISDYIEGLRVLPNCTTSPLKHWSPNTRPGMKQRLPAALSRAMASLEERKRIAETYKHQDLQARKNYEDATERHTLMPMEGPEHYAQHKGADLRSPSCTRNTSTSSLPTTWTSSLHLRGWSASASGRSR